MVLESSGFHAGKNAKTPQTPESWENSGVLKRVDRPPQKNFGGGDRNWSESG